MDRALGKKAQGIHPAARWLGMFLTTCLLRLLFIVDTIPKWGEVLGKIFSFQSTWVSWGLIDTFNTADSTLIFDLFHLTSVNEMVRGLSLFVFMVVGFIICLVPENNIKRKFSNSAASIIPAIILFVWAMLSLGSESAFRYFNF